MASEQPLPRFCASSALARASNRRPTKTPKSYIYNDALGVIRFSYTIVAGERMKGYLIAETNETGSIEWVWVKRRKQRAPRPFRGLKDKLIDVKDFEIHGAGKKAVQKWISKAPL